ncbi:thiol-disulfide oxidoreductase DCC family protein [Parageobacillus sp. VR-IP]|uniref:thiol-disulfide oxidoreductase DCC family protein n=1 Tax=Parageobacillus sp. VR-IP TaxID=2742205 RepID=UPI001582BBDB|nr:thiol-disulfide oxidoreductase DCC family protein [Parageobacillus sp. VR-IP]NUK29481.1 thiol-disulfide oxidoreductase DCC family protein [Parageobacillus sp. VR-IP]
MNTIILFDGVCSLCSASVQFIIARDPHAVFRFASLQSEVGEALRQKFGVPEVDSLVLLEDDRYYTKSSAALRICRRLTGAWKLFYIFWIVPKPLRDYVYGFVAKHRYEWFGKRDHCLMPTPDIRARFLDERQ